jgi:hypothetical protein
MSLARADRRLELSADRRARKIIKHLTEDTTMESSLLWTTLGVTLILLSSGCRQEVPKAPPTPTTAAPITSATPKPSPETDMTAPSAPSASASDIGSNTGRSAEDALITGKVRAELLKASDGKSIEIDVETQNGVVHLTGFARSNSDIDSALEIAKRVEGVKDVQQKLVVKPS